MDDLDRKILAVIQDDFPLASRPYAVIGERVGCSEEETFRRVVAMKRKGIIRRIGGNFDSRKLGHVSTLVGLRVPPADIERVAEQISSYPEVTHNYQRADSVNLWFTIVAKSRDRLEQIVREIRQRIPEVEMLELPAKKIFKLKVRFDPASE